jgi:hypothetical protein
MLLPIVRRQRPVAQMAFAGYLVKNPINWRLMPLDIIGVLGNAISQSIEELVWATGCQWLIII